MSVGLFIAGSQIPPLPLDFITESSAILAKKGAGKTNAAIVLLEEVYAAGAPVVSIDPKGDHWGIRANGAGDGLPIPVFGGLHGDIPLEPAAGAYIADLVRSKRLSVVLDVSEFTIGERARFLTAFADRLYRYDAHDPMLLLLEEAHEYIPQQVRGEDARMVGAFERLVKLGRHKGIGVVMVTQRSSSLNKNVLTQADNLFVLRTTSPQDRLAVKGWLDTNSEAASILAELQSLQTGECWLVQPERGAPVKFRWRMRHTYDAGATPKLGDKPRPPASLADVDLTEISAAMADTIEKAKAEDPKQLRATIADLQKQLAKRPVEEVVREVETIVEIPVLSDEDRALLTSVHDVAGSILARFPELRSERVLVARQSAPMTPRVVPRTVEARATRSDRAASTSGVSLGKAQRAVLTVLATYGERTHVQLAILAGYSSKSGGFANTLSGLRTAGYIVGGRAGISVTPEGLEALGEFEPLPSGQALIDHWFGQVGQQHRAILSALLEVYPRSLTHNEIAERTEYSPTSGGFANSLSKLRTLELIHGGRDAITVSETLGGAR